MAPPGRAGTAVAMVRQGLALAGPADSLPGRPAPSRAVGRAKGAMACGHPMRAPARPLSAQQEALLIPPTTLSVKCRRGSGPAAS